MAVDQAPMNPLVRYKKALEQIAEGAQDPRSIAAEALRSRRSPPNRATTQRNTARLANRPITFAFSPSHETDFIDYFSHNLPDDLRELNDDGFQFVPQAQLGDADVIIVTAHGSDLFDEIMVLREKTNPAALVAVWLWDNHLVASNNLRTCTVADYVFPSHAYAMDYLDRHWITMMHVPACSVQWSSGEAATLFAKNFSIHRSDKLLANYVNYPLAWRRTLLEKLQTEMPQADVILTDPDDRKRYFGKTREERAGEWLHYKTTIILPTEKDLSTRLFDALLAGQVILVPVDVPDLDQVIQPDMQVRLGILRLPDLELATISRMTAEAIRLYDEQGELGALARHKYILEHHMLKHRVKSILEMIRSMANKRAVKPAIDLHPVSKTPS
jgi:hypothetical protein